VKGKREKGKVKRKKNCGTANGREWTRSAFKGVNRTKRKEGGQLCRRCLVSSTGLPAYMGS